MRRINATPGPRMALDGLLIRRPVIGHSLSWCSHQKLPFSERLKIGPTSSLWISTKSMGARSRQPV